MFWLKSQVCSDRIMFYTVEQDRVGIGWYETPTSLEVCNEDLVIQNYNFDKVPENKILDI